MENKLRQLIARRKQLEEGVLPFVEPQSLAEDLAYDEWFFVGRQIGVIHAELKKEFENK